MQSQKNDHERKQSCPDCKMCQGCAESRCKMCRPMAKPCKKLSFQEQIDLFNSLNPHLQKR